MNNLLISNFQLPDLLEEDIAIPHKETLPIQMHYEKFTPEEAQRLFDARPEQRPTRLKGEKSVEKYRNDMNTGKWREFDRSQAPILFDKKGRCRGGQHRLLAVATSTVEGIWFPVVRDATEIEIANQDTGINRTFNDHAHMFYNIPKLSSIKASRILAIAKIIGEMLDGKKPTPERAAEIANTYKVELECVNDLITSDGVIRSSSPIMAGFIYAIAGLGGAKMEYEMWKKALTNFDGNTNEPGSSLAMLSRTMDSRRLNELFLKTLCALKALHNGKTPKRITANEEHLHDW